MAFEPGQPLPAEFGKPVQEFPHPSAVKSVAIHRRRPLPHRRGGQAGASLEARLRPADEDPRSTRTSWIRSRSTRPASCSPPAATTASCASGTWPRARRSKTINAHTTAAAEPDLRRRLDAGRQAAGHWQLRQDDQVLGRRLGQPGPRDQARHRSAAAGPEARPAAPGAGRQLAGSRVERPAGAGHIDQVFTLAFTKDGSTSPPGRATGRSSSGTRRPGSIVREFPNPDTEAGRPRSSRRRRTPASSTASGSHRTGRGWSPPAPPRAARDTSPCGRSPTGSCSPDRNCRSARSTRST